MEFTDEVDWVEVDKSSLLVETSIQDDNMVSK